MKSIRMKTETKKTEKMIFIRKWSTLLLFICWLFPAGAVAGQTIKQQFPAESLSARIGKLIDIGNVNIAHDTKLLAPIQVPPLDASTGSIEEVLSKSLATTGLMWKKISDRSYAITAPQGQQDSERQSGTLTGTVIDKNGFPIPGATVQIMGTSLGAATDIKGKFSMTLPAGRTYSVEIRCISYQPIRISDVKITSGKTTPLDIVLQEATEELGEVIVTASYKKASVQALYTRQKERVAVTDGISADLIKKTSDNNVAQVLRRLPGVSISDGKFVTIRGLSERYNNVNLNGSDMPSTEPNRKNFAFDVIPAGLVDNIVVAKTFTPDMSAEFAGGVVEINTLALPDSRFLTVSLGTGFNTMSTGKTMWSGKRFASDYLFGNQSDRYWFGRDWNPDWMYDLMGGPLNTAENFNNWEAINRMNAKVPNTWGMHSYKARPTQSYSISAGLPFSVGEHKFGIVAGINYRHEDSRQTYGCDNRRDANNEQHNQTPFTTIYHSEKYGFATGIGAIGNIGWEYRGHKITWKNMFNNRFTLDSYYQVTDSDDDVKNVTLMSDPRRMKLFQTRLEGEHDVWHKRFRLTWFTDYNKLDREQPDERNIRGSIYNGRTEDGREAYISWGRFGITDGSYSHIFTGDLNETKKNIGAAVEVPFTVLGNLQKMKVGYQGSFRDAGYRQYVLNVTNTKVGGLYGRPVHIPDYTVPIDSLLTPEHFLDSTFNYVPWGQNPGGDGYDGSLDVNSAFIMAELTFLKRLHLNGGVRLEKSEMKSTVNSRKFENGNWVDTLRTDKSTDWYPSVSLVYNITDAINFRASYSKTISRFDFREISYQRYFDVARDMEITGNDTLKNTYTKNIDLRAEWYPSAGEVVSVSAFYKKFKNPIETYVWENANNLYARPINLESATGKGLEVNLRKSLAFVAPATFLKNVYVSLNAMYMKMEVKYKQAAGYKQDSIRKRPLQDLVPYSVNAALTWQGDVFGAALHYGTTGRKLLKTSTIEAEDEYEASRHILDAQISARLLKGRMEIKANASDLLAHPIIQYQNRGFKNSMNDWTSPEQDFHEQYTDDMDYNKGKDWLSRKFRKGTSFSFSVSYKF